MTPFADFGKLALGCIAISLITALFRVWPQLSNVTTVALCFLVVAIRVAADNLQSSWADERQRRDQGELIVTEVDRLTHLFQNILEMAHIDAGAVTQDARWVAPSEIVDAARSRVEHTLPHVFERFYRGAEAKRNRFGTGMGLAIARGVLAVEEGRISVDNCADGGARFTIVVPAEVK
jgi:K+-sensing histidine kinase KdpD